MNSINNSKQNSKTNLILFILYNYFVYPAMFVASFLSGIVLPKMRKGFELRRKHNGQYPWLTLNIKNPIWIHCASGEFEYAKALIREIKTKKPTEKIIVTYFSPSYIKQIQSFQTQEKLIDAFLPMPWDCPSVMRDFFKEVQPKLILISRTDLWPQMLREAKHQHVKVVLYSALLSEQSSKVKNPFVRFIYSRILSFIDQIYCVTYADKLNFDKITDPKKVIVAGDTRFDQVFHRLNTPKPIKSLFDKTHPLIICGSTWAEDERVIIGAFPELIQNGMKIIIAPHEPSASHIESLEKQFQKLNLTADKYSDPKFSNATQWTSDILIIDQVGILAELYSKAQFAFIGGSFKKQVHSVMEALACGCYTFYGPHHINNREAMDFQNKEVAPGLAIGNVIQSPQELADKIIKLQKRNLIEDQKIIQNQVRSLTGASKRIASFF